MAVTQTNDAQVCEPCSAHLHTRSSPHVMTLLPHQGRPASEITEALARIVDMVPERTLLAFAVSPAGLRRLHSLVRYRSPLHLFFPNCHEHGTKPLPPSAALTQSRASPPWQRLVAQWVSKNVLKPAAKQSSRRSRTQRDGARYERVGSFDAIVATGVVVSDAESEAAETAAAAVEAALEALGKQVQHNPLGALRGVRHPNTSCALALAHSRSLLLHTTIRLFTCEPSIRHKPPLSPPSSETWCCLLPGHSCQHQRAPLMVDPCSAWRNWTSWTPRWHCAASCR